MNTTPSTGHPTVDPEPNASKPIRAVAIATLLICMAGCSGGGGAGGVDGAVDTVSTSCPVPTGARLLLSALSIGALADATQSGGATLEGTGWHLGLSQGLVGAPGAISFIVAEACTEARSPGAHTCSSQDPERPSGFWLTHDRCFTLGCEASGIHLLTAYMAMTPIVDPAQRHAFSYDMAPPFSGSVRYDPNPLVTWRLDVNDPAQITATATLDQHLQVTPPGGAALDFSYQGSAATTSKDGDTHAVVDLTFPQLASSGAVVVHIQSGVNGPEGTIKALGDTLATFSNATPPVTWVASCPLMGPGT